ncbi:hypothetical protein LUB14_29415 [Klebsiella pneumoniae]|uniref:hypothetical protein n=1 Tax=Klebsiella pneumoniae TaxID=573 RepID=UPI001E413A87|nr:hypothetical protein [Klebsiella pneumoniae]
MQAKFEGYVKKVQKYIGSYAAEMNGLDVVVLTAGVGYHVKAIRVGGAGGGVGGRPRSRGLGDVYKSPITVMAVS